MEAAIADLSLWKYKLKFRTCVQEQIEYFDSIMVIQLHWNYRFLDFHANPMT